MRRLAVLAALVSALLPATSLVTARAVVAAPDGVIRVGSKSFTESYLLAEMVAQVVEQVGEARAERRVGLGGTGLTQRALEPRRLTMSASLGFANTYALAVREEEAQRLGLRTIGDLGRHPDLTAAFTSGFIEREDGWPGLRARYGIGLARVEVMEHALAYRAVASGQVDVMDVFSTDGQLERLRLRLLEDERHFFPDYAAVLLARREMTVRYPRTWARLREVLEGRLDAARMARLNAMADLDGRPVAEVAATFLAGREPEPGGGGRGRALLAEIAGLTRDHLLLVLVSVGAAVLLGIP